MKLYKNSTWSIYGFQLACTLRAVEGQGFRLFEATGSHWDTSELCDDESFVEGHQCTSSR